MKNKQLFLRFLVLLCTLALVSGAASAAPGKSKAPEFAANPFDLQAAQQLRNEVHGWLASEAVSEGRSSPITVSFANGELLEIDNARGEVPERAGLTRAVSHDFTFGDINLAALKGKTLARTQGAVRETEDGGYVFTAALESPEATALRIHFRNFRLPDNAGLYLYTESGQVFGPYTGRGPLGDGEFWSHTVMGEQLTLQLRHFGPPSPADLRSTSFNIGGIAHIRPRFLGGQCSVNAVCVEQLSCLADNRVNSAVTAAKSAVAHMQFVSGGWVYMCSGGLLSDENPDNQYPYFLTANHCLSRDREARTLENYFQWTAPCGASTCDDVESHFSQNQVQDLRTLGATVKASNRTGDYTLLELGQQAPAGSAFLGWITTAVADSDGQPLYRISHPSGASQSYSEHLVDTEKVTCRSWPRGDWIYSADFFGATEGGSSGSPVVNAAGQVVGQLSGACGYNVNNVCDSASNATVDGAFAAYFDEIEPILSPQPVSCGNEEICGNGVDDNCDGWTDEQDIVSCPSDPGGGTGKGAGESCTSNEECLSLNCKGKPGSKVCK
jgi:V8-like Glu-specific endopeptidase